MAEFDEIEEEKRLGHAPGHSVPTQHVPGGHGSVGAGHGHSGSGNDVDEHPPAGSDVHGHPAPRPLSIAPAEQGAAGRGEGGGESFLSRISALARDGVVLTSTLQLVDQLNKQFGRAAALQALEEVNQLIKRTLSNLIASAEAKADDPIQYADNPMAIQHSTAAEPAQSKSTDDDKASHPPVHSTSEVPPLASSLSQSPQGSIETATDDRMHTGSATSAPVPVDSNADTMQHAASVVDTKTSEDSNRGII